MRSLATKVLSSNTDAKKKHYPANYVEEETDDLFVAHDEEALDEDYVLQSLAEQGDEDAQTVTEFEDQLIDVCQESQELSLCFSAYAEARSRIRDKLRARGFWPPRNAAGKGKGGRKGVMKGANKRRHQTLADRIAASSCRICGMKGHWKWECPRKSMPSGMSAASHNSQASNAEINVATKVTGDTMDDEVVDQIPNGTILSLNDLLESSYKDPCAEAVPPLELTDVQKHEHGVNEEFIFMTESKRFQALDRYLKVASLERRLRNVCFGKECRTDFLQRTESVLNTEVECPAIIDTGASKSVIGRKKVQGLISSLPRSVQQHVQYGKSETVFRFGNNGTLSSVGVVYIPFGCRWMRLEIVDGETPFLLSNAFLKATAADVSSTESKLYFRDLDVGVPLKSNSKGLFTVELSKILKAVSSKSQVSSKVSSCEVVTNVISEVMFAKAPNNTAAMSKYEPPPVTAAGVAQQSVSESESNPNCPEPRGADHGAEERGELYGGCKQGADARCGTPSSGGSSSGLREPCSRTSLPPTWHSDLAPVGRTDLPGRQALGCDVHPGVQQGCQVHDVHEEPQQPDLAMGKELPELCQGDGHAAWESQCLPDTQGKLGSELVDQRMGFAGQSSRPDAHHSLVTEARTTGASHRGEWQSYESGEGCRQGAVHPYADGHPSEGVGSHEGRTVNNLKEGLEQLPSSKVSKENAKMSTLECELKAKSNEIQQELDELANRLVKDMDIMAAITLEADALRSKSTKAHSQSISRLDLLEIYCEENSRLTEVATKMGLKAQRFTRADGDLRTPEGRSALWKIVVERQPRHVWMAPECGPWGNFSRLNMCRSSSTRHKIQTARAEQQTHLELCREVYEYQVVKGNHFHMEQPQGSEVFDHV